MATDLSPAHRSWRAKAFVATWLSYVGFYFCRRPFSAAKAAIGDETHWNATTLANIWTAYLVAYALGQFLAAGMGTKLGPRRNVLLGMGVSLAATLTMGFTSSPWFLGGLVVLNGFAQATGWSGNVGTMAAWFHKHERGRVMGIWATNFNVGALVSGWVMAWVLGLHAAGAPEPWRWCFFAGAGILAVVWIQFFVLQRNRPEDVGLTPIRDPGAASEEPSLATPAPKGIGLSRLAWTNLWLVAGFYFFVKFVRYAIWSWAAYFLERNYHLSGSAANVYATAFDLMGVPGVYFAGWVSDRFFNSRRSGIALIMMLGMLGATGLLIAFGGTSVAVFAALLGIVGFTLFGPDALLTGAGAIDIGGRRAATFAAAIISGFGSMGPILQEQVIGRVYDSTSGNLAPVFLMWFGSAAMAALACALLVWNTRRSGKGI